MIKTGLETEADIYRIIRDSDLGKAIEGKVYRRGFRPSNSKAEDIVVHFLSGTIEQFQKGVVVANVYTNDITLQDGTEAPNIGRLTELSALVHPMLRDQSTDYDIIEDETPTITPIEGTKQTALTIRLRFFHIAR